MILVQKVKKENKESFHCKNKDSNSLSSKISKGRRESTFTLFHFRSFCLAISNARLIVSILFHAYTNQHGVLATVAPPATSFSIKICRAATRNKAAHSSSSTGKATISLYREMHLCFVFSLRKDSDGFWLCFRV